MSSKSPEKTSGTAQRASNVPFVDRAKVLPGKPLSLWVQRTPGFCRLDASPEASTISVVVTRPFVIAELKEGVCPRALCNSTDPRADNADRRRVRQKKANRSGGDTPKGIRTSSSLQPVTCKARPTVQDFGS